MDNKYIKCLLIMETISKKLPSRILETDFDKASNDERHLLALYFDAYKGVESVCSTIRTTAITQSSILLRHLLEIVSLIITLSSEDYIALSEYVEFVKFKSSIENLDNRKKRDEIIKFASIKGDTIKHNEAFSFIDFGWMKKLNIDDFGINAVMERANFSDLKSWRLFFNKFTHMSLTMLNVSKGGLFNEQLIYITCILFDSLGCQYHNLTKYNFRDFDDVSFENFRKLYSEITEVRRNMTKDLNRLF